MNEDVGRVQQVEPGSRASTEPANGLGPAGFDPSRKEPFAKLFETPHGQLLAYLDETEDEDPCIVVMGAEHLGIRPSAKLSGWPGDEKKGQSRAFAAMGQAEANKMAAEFHHMLGGLMSDSDGSPSGRDGNRLDGEAATARAEGIAQPPPL